MNSRARRAAVPVQPLPLGPDACASKWQRRRVEKATPDGEEFICLGLAARKGLATPRQGEAAASQQAKIYGIGCAIGC